MTDAREREKNGVYGQALVTSELGGGGDKALLC